MRHWPTLHTHRLWLDTELRRLIAFGDQVVAPRGGAAYLDADGAPDLARGVETWITARTVHVYGLAMMLGLPGSREIATGAFAGLTGLLRDAEDGGWFRSVGEQGAPDVVAGKSCYDHAFVLLAASTATLAGISGARGLLDDAIEVFLERFWDEEAGRCLDSWDATWSDADPYRGLNANMHAVEAMLAVADCLDEEIWRERAARVCAFVISLAGHTGRLPEHFDEAWEPLLELNRDRPGDPFKPFGATVGHGLEWARLLLQVEAAGAGDRSAELVDAAVTLFDRAVADGWARDGATGFVYTTDWQGRPVVRDRMHWVAAEAVAAADALYRRTGEARFAEMYALGWDYIATHLIDGRGSWHHQLDAKNAPTDGVWSGKPDLYHAVQATLLPRVPLGPSLAKALRDGSVAA